MMKVLMNLILVVVMTLIMASGVKADGQYGGGTTTPEEKPREEVVHSTVDAGFGDNLMVYAAALGSAGAALYGVARLTRRVYLFER